MFLDAKTNLDTSLSLSCLEWEVRREFLQKRSELIPPPVVGTVRFEENKLTGIKYRRMNPSGSGSGSNNGSDKTFLNNIKIIYIFLNLHKFDIRWNFFHFFF